ncbi:hypothetical protein BpHYR1_020853 [Brachionus plicatilis]|uniref:Uncharacterized protein n=1 Tax=Brachionus plicatilis TaxID=10195 RepID=A0A3M7R2J7_BRAPC|nr:hypothetical protein BpHYR1_020853 [Brachionus plicatilis]
MNILLGTSTVSMEFYQDQSDDHDGKKLSYVLSDEKIKIWSLLVLIKPEYFTKLKNSRTFSIINKF